MKTITETNTTSPTFIQRIYSWKVLSLIALFSGIILLLSSLIPFSQTSPLYTGLTVFIFFASLSLMDIKIALQWKKKDPTLGNQILVFILVLAGIFTFLCFPVLVHWLVFDRREVILSLILQQPKPTSPFFENVQDIFCNCFIYFSGFLPIVGIFSIGSITLMFGFYLFLFILGFQFLLKSNFMPGMKDKEKISPFKEFLHKLLKSLSLIFYSVLSLKVICLSLIKLIVSALVIIPIEFYQCWHWTILYLIFAIKYLKFINAINF